MQTDNVSGEKENRSSSITEREHGSSGWDWRLQLQTRPHSVASQRLVPGMDGVQVSKSQKLKTFLGISPIPVLWFNVEVGVPTVLPVEHQSIPFTLRVVPKWSITSEIIQHVPQVIKPINLKFTLSSDLGAAAENGYQSLKYANWWGEQDLASNLSQARDILITLPITGDGQATDIGVAVNLRINHTLNRNGTFKDFCALHLRRKHEMSWQLQCGIAGETIDVKGTQAVRIVTTSSEGSDWEMEESGGLNLDLSILDGTDALDFGDI